jgi:hypothetical protein
MKIQGARKLALPCSLRFLRRHHVSGIARRLGWLISTPARSLPRGPRKLGLVGDCRFSLYYGGRRPLRSMTTERSSCILGRAEALRALCAFLLRSCSPGFAA